MKKVFKILVINVLIVVFFLITAELTAFLIEINVLVKEGIFSEKVFSKKFERIINHYKFVFSSYNRTPYCIDEFRSPIVNDGFYKNIVILGCSWPYGHRLEENQTFHYKLAKTTGNNVYNFALCSTGPKEMLHLLRNEKFREENFLIKDNIVEYFIYVVIDDSLRRLIYNLNYSAPRYKLTKDNGLILQKNDKIYCPFLYRQLKLLQFNLTSKEKLQKIFNIYLKEINNEIKNNFKNSKNEPTELIILKWGMNYDIDELSKVENSGVRIIDVFPLINTDLNNEVYYISEDDHHPNEKAWELVVPALVKELNL